MNYDPQSEPNKVWQIPFEKESWKGRLEAVLFAAGDPMSVRDLARLLETVPDTMEFLLDELSEEYEKAGRGIALLRLEDEVQLATKAAYSSDVIKLGQVNERQTLSKGALECLAIVAYRQPVTRVEIDEIRGVSSEYVMGKLLDRGFVEVIGHKSVPGRPRLYATTEEFLRQFGFPDLKAFSGDESYRTLIGNLPQGASSEVPSLLFESAEDGDRIEE